MNAQTILTTLDKQPVVYHKSADFERYILLRKDALDLILYAYREGELKEVETCVLWSKDAIAVAAWITPEAPIFTPEITKNFYPFLSFWVQLYQHRKWNENIPHLAEIVRTIHTYCRGAAFDVFLVKEGLPLNLAEPWEIDIAAIPEIYDYDS